MSKALKIPPGIIKQVDGLLEGAIFSIVIEMMLTGKSTSVSIAELADRTKESPDRVRDALAELRLHNRLRLAADNALPWERISTLSLRHMCIVVAGDQGNLDLDGEAPATSKRKKKDKPSDIPPIAFKSRDEVGADRKVVGSSFLKCTIFGRDAQGILCPREEAAKFTCSITIKDIGDPVEMVGREAFAQDYDTQLQAFEAWDEYVKTYSPDSAAAPAIDPDKLADWIAGLPVQPDGSVLVSPETFTLILGEWGPIDNIAFAEAQAGGELRIGDRTYLSVGTNGHHYEPHQVLKWLSEVAADGGHDNLMVFPHTFDQAARELGCVTSEIGEDGLPFIKYGGLTFRRFEGANIGRPDDEAPAKSNSKKPKTTKKPKAAKPTVPTR